MLLLYCFISTTRVKNSLRANVLVWRVNNFLKEIINVLNTIDISYTLDSASHPAGGRKLKPDRSRILREAAILVVPTERDNLYILYYGNGQS